MGWGVQSPQASQTGTSLVDVVYYDHKTLPHFCVNQVWSLKMGLKNHTRYKLCASLMYPIIIRLTSCRCVLLKWLVALGALCFTWNTTLRGSIQSTTPTLVLWGTITYGLHPRYIVKDVWNLNLLSQWNDVWLFIGNDVFVALGI